MIQGESWKLMLKSICHFIFFKKKKINQIAHIWIAVYKHLFSHLEFTLDFFQNTVFHL